MRPDTSNWRDDRSYDFFDTLPIEGLACRISMRRGTPTFVVSFDAIIADAEGRNHTFLEILREGMKKYAGEHDDSKSSGDE